MTRALTTVYTPPAWCSNRFAVYSNTPPWDSTGVPSSGWVDPSFTKCIPEQYTATFPTFSPGICPQHMTIAAKDSRIIDGKTKWTGRCCQSGFTTPDIDPDYFCTSAVTDPIALLVVPDITTTDIYTTIPHIQSVIHDQVTVVWEENDLSLFPAQVAAGYASLMGITWEPAMTNDGATTVVVQTPAVSVETSIPTTRPGVPSSAPPTKTPSSSSISHLSPSSSSSSKPIPSSSMIISMSVAESSLQTTIASQSQITSYTSSRTPLPDPGVLTMITVVPVTAMTHSSSSRVKPKSHRIRNLFLAWTALYLATYLT